MLQSERESSTISVRNSKRLEGRTIQEVRLHGDEDWLWGVRLILDNGDIVAFTPRNTSIQIVEYYDRTSTSA